MKRVLLCLAVFAPVFLNAQSLSMEQVIRLAQDSTIRAHMAESSVEAFRWEHEQFLALRRPQLALMLTPGYQKMSFEPNNCYYRPRDYNMLNAMTELRVEQKALLIGGEFYANTGLLFTRYFDNSEPARLFSTVPVGVGYSNELISYNPFKWEKKLADLKLRESELEYVKSLGSIALEVVNLYVNCYIALARYEICERNAEVTRNLLDIGREKFDIASISKNELSALELHSLNAENALFDAIELLESARISLLSYLKIQDSGQILDLSKPEIQEYRLLNTDEVLTLAHNFNPESIHSQAQKVSAEQEVHKAKVQGRFLQSAVDLNVGLQSTVAQIGNVYHSQNPFVVGSVTFRIPIFDGGLARSRSNAAESALEYASRAEQEVLRDLDLQVNIALRQFNNQQNLIQRTSRALTLADESFDLARELYEEGEVDINTFILAQNRKDEAHTNYLNSLRNYWKSFYTLRMLCGPEL